MKKQIFCLLLTFFFLIIVTCQAENKDKVYTDQDLKQPENNTQKQNPQKNIQEQNPLLFMPDNTVISEKTESQFRYKPSPDPEVNKAILSLSKALAFTIGLYFIISAPFIYIFSVTSLMIRDHILKSRKEYNSNDSEYQILYWIATIISYISIVIFFIGIFFLIASFQ
jgi:hypothetical protein